MENNCEHNTIAHSKCNGIRCVCPCHSPQQHPKEESTMAYKFNRPLSEVTEKEWKEAIEKAGQKSSQDQKEFVGVPEEQGEINK